MYYCEFVTFRLVSWVLILSGSLSGNGKISCWQAFNNVRDSIQEVFCCLRPVSLKSSVTYALVECVCKLYQPDADIVWLTEWRRGMFWRKKLNCKTYHLQELRLSKVSTVRNINSSFGNMHLTLILTNQCLTIMVRSETVINIFTLWRHSLLPEAPLQLIKCGCSKSVCKTSWLTFYTVPICVEDPCINIASEQWLLNYYFYVDSGIFVTISTRRPCSPILTSEGSKIGRFY